MGAGATGSSSGGDLGVVAAQVTGCLGAVREGDQQGLVEVES